jgi:tRNA-dihydrouridine synthase C
MEGVTDWIVRELFAELGSVDYAVTEFVRVSAEVVPAKVLKRMCPELTQPPGVGKFAVHLQLLGGHPERLAQTAQNGAALGATAIDLNFGCPAPTVNQHDGGASLLREPSRIERIVAAVRRAVEPSVSVSAKVRLGWENPGDIVDTLKAVEAGGADWITIHARTKLQGYAPPADWKMLGHARAITRLPVVANGDIDSVEALERCARETGCDRFMIGRGAIEQPEIFRLLRGVEHNSWSASQRLGVLRSFIEKSLNAGPDRDRYTLARCKFWLRALSKRRPELTPLFEHCKRIESVASLCGALDDARERLRDSTQLDNELCTQPLTPNRSLLTQPLANSPRL